jgi:hypothetical protein
MTTNFNLTDMDLLQGVPGGSGPRNALSVRSMPVRAEIAAETAEGKWRAYEVPISYSARSYDAAKKITWHSIIRFRSFDAAYRGPKSINGPLVEFDSSVVPTWKIGQRVLRQKSIYHQLAIGDNEHLTVGDDRNAHLHCQTERVTRGELIAVVQFVR